MSIITLPKSSLKYLDDTIIKVEIPEKPGSRKNYVGISKAKGLWKNKAVDPVEYQRTVRADWR